MGDKWDGSLVQVALLCTFLGYTGYQPDSFSPNSVNHSSRYAFDDEVIRVQVLVDDKVVLTQKLQKLCRMGLLNVSLCR